MNKKIKLLSLISTPILLGGGFAALTLVNQCGNKSKPSTHYNMQGTNWEGYEKGNGASLDIRINSINNNAEIHGCLSTYTATDLVIPDEVWDEHGVPHPLTRIMYAAFSISPAVLKGSLTLGKNIVEIQESAFSNLTSITSLNLGNVEIIDGGAFENCSGIRGTLNLPSTLTSIGSNAFASCTLINSIVMPSSVVQIRDNAFYRVGREVETGVISIDLNDFDEAPIFNDANGWSQRSFSNVGNSSLINILTSNGSWTSLYARQDLLLSASLDSSVWDAGANYFNMDGTNWPGYNKIDMNSSTLQVTVENNVATITYAKEYQAQNLVLPNEVWDKTNKEFYPLSYIGEYAFQNNDKITGLLQLGNSIIAIRYASFINCSNLGAINFGNSMQSIGSHAFAQCTGLTSLDIPSNIVAINDGVFSSCTNISSVTIRSTLNHIGQNAFFGTGSNTSGINLILDSFIAQPGDWQKESLSNFTSPGENVISFSESSWLPSAAWSFLIGTPGLPSSSWRLSV